MPIKTSFLELDKIQDNEYYNSQLENENLDKIDSTLKNHEDRTASIEEKIHKKDQLTVELKSEKNLVSTRDSFGGACGFEIEGALDENLVKNGEFNNGTSNWIARSGDVFESSGNITITGNGTSMYPQIDQMFYNISEGETFFIRATLRADDVMEHVALWIDGLLSGHGQGVLHLNPLLGEEITLYKKVTVPNGYVGGLALRLQSKYTDRATSNGKSMSAIGRKGVTMIKLFGDDQSLTDDELNTKYQYFEGLQPFRNVAIESAGKNLFDGDVELGFIDANGNNAGGGTGSRSKKFTRVETNKSYTISFDTGDDLAFRVYEYDQNFNFIGFNLVNRISFGNRLTYTFSATGRYIRFRTDTNFTGFMKNVQLEEGTTPTTYEPYKSSKIVLDDPLAKLPNGVADKIVRENGKTIKYVRTNVGQDGNLYSFIEEDFISINTNNTNLDVITVRNDSFENLLQGNAINNNVIVSNGLKQISSHQWQNNITFENTIYFTSNKTARISVPKNTYTDLNEAKADLAGATIVYQLENPQIIDLSHELEPLNSYEGYTQFSVSDGVIEGEKANVSFYGGATPSYYINILGNAIVDDSPLKFRVNKINAVVYDCRNITELGVKQTLDSFGNERWVIAQSVVEANNIDINQIYVDYTTTETNGLANAKITYNADISSAVSSNSSSLNSIGEQVDFLTNALTNYMEFSPILHGQATEYMGYKHNIRIENGRLYMEGKINVVNVSSGSLLMNIGKQYAPKSNLSFRVPTDIITITADISVTTEGDVNLSYSGGTPNVVTLAQVTYRVGD